MCVLGECTLFIKGCVDVRDDTWSARISTHTRIPCCRGCAAISTHVRMSRCGRCACCDKNSVYRLTLFSSHLALMCAQFIHSGLGDKGGGVQLVCDCTYGLAWEVIFNGRKDRCVVWVSVFFNARGSVRGYVCVNTHTHTPAAQTGYSMRAQGSGWDTWRAWRIQMD